MNYLFTHLPQVGAYTLQHLALVGTSLVLALAIALPLGVYAARQRRFGRPLLGVLGAIYTIPSLALLAVLVRYSGLGFWTAVIVLVAYAQFVLVRNIAAGLLGVDPAQVDAARGLGMSGRQRFWRVELPLAFPVMLGGVRVAAVSMIAIATLAAYASAGGLGTFIFDGLSRQYPAETLAGSVPAAILAIAVDALFRGIERTVAH
ncbi:MAG: ABC transporter permease [Candidatus Eremiobacteraeota bacterium]|nr:ABC transporter permease [Candidatus Eremiobacteraeota bacterium]